MAYRKEVIPAKPPESLGRGRHDDDRTRPPKLLKNTRHEVKAKHLAPGLLEEPSDFNPVAPWRECRRKPLLWQARKTFCRVSLSSRRFWSKPSQLRRHSRTSVPLVFLCSSLFCCPSLFRCAESLLMARETQEGLKRIIKIGGVSLEYHPTRLVNARTGVSGELRAMLGTVANITLEREIAYKGDRLPAGTYPLRVVRTPEKRYYLAFAPRRQSRLRGGGLKGPGMGLASSFLEEARSEATEKKEKRSTWGLGARLRFSRARTPTAEVRFGLKQIDRRKRFQILIQAGSTLGRASLRLRDPERGGTQTVTQEQTPTGAQRD